MVKIIKMKKRNHSKGRSWRRHEIKTLPKKKKKKNSRQGEICDSSLGVLWFCSCPPWTSLAISVSMLLICDITLVMPACPLNFLSLHKTWQTKHKFLKATFQPKWTFKNLKIANYWQYLKKKFWVCSCTWKLGKADGKQLLNQREAERKNSRVSASYLWHLSKPP